jgi:hypothetical protein
MALSRLLLAWGAVTLLLILWREVERRLFPSPGDAPPIFPALVVEALLLTLLAGLWFASLGSGGAALLFLVAGALIEIPGRLRSRTWPWRTILIGIARVVVSGLVLGVVLG